MTLSTGVDVSTGDYGRDADTEVISVPMSVRVSHDRWSVRVSVPYLTITGPADVADIVVGDGGVSEGDAGGAVTRTGTVRGLGDTTIAVTRNFRHVGPREGYLDITGRVRLPTGDEEDGLGVGVTDYALATEYGISGREGGGYVGVGRRFLSDRGTMDRNDGWQLNLGAWRYLGRRTTLGVDGYWRESSFEGGEDPAEVGGYVAHRFNENWRATASLNAGLSDASPDLNFGVRVSWRSRISNDRD
ncbi:MAG: hypothetical protein AB7O98_07260 [Hyphomonadaceae bacterium]